MQDSLYEYLVLTRQLTLPGIGTIGMKKTSSSYDFREKIFNPPAYLFTLENKNDSPPRELYSWLAESMKITEWEATRMVNDFSAELKSRISSGGQADWEKVGSFQRNSIGDIVLYSLTITAEGEGVLPAEKVLREHAEHTVLVGEQEKSSLEMEELLSASGETKDIGLIIAIVLTVLSLMFIGWHFSENGLKTSSTGNRTILYTK